MPYCSNCGNKVTDEMLFCPQCGNKVMTSRTGFTEDADTETHNYTDYTIETKTKKPEPIASNSIKRNKLYKQWVEYANLPDEETPVKKAPRDMPAREERNKLSPNVLYLLIGVAILILCVGVWGVVLLIMQP